jgi:ATP-dependent Zn protease
MSRVVEREVRRLLESALAIAKECVLYNQALHEELSKTLVREERLEGMVLLEILERVKVQFCFVFCKVGMVICSRYSIYPAP